MFCIFSVIISQEIKYSMDPVWVVGISASLPRNRVATRDVCDLCHIYHSDPDHCWRRFDWHYPGTRREPCFTPGKTSHFGDHLTFVDRLIIAHLYWHLIYGIINDNCKENKKTKLCFMSPRATFDQASLGFMIQNKKLGSKLFNEDPTNEAKQK